MVWSVVLWCVVVCVSKRTSGEEFHWREDNWHNPNDSRPGCGFGSGSASGSASVTLSEPSTSLSIGHDVLEHLMPPAQVPSLDLRSLRATSRNARHRRGKSIGSAQGTFMQSPANTGSIDMFGGIV